MNLVEELKWRGMVQDITPGLEEKFATEKLTAYIGFDPTAPSLTIGNYVPTMLLTLLQKHGHHPIVLMGGATGRVGDPSGKKQERQLKTYEELDKNLAHQKSQFAKFLNFDSDCPNPAIIVNNHDFYKEMNVLDFLRDVGKTLTVSYMMSKDSVTTRLESGLSFTEFSYQLLQAYDFQQLYSKYNCHVQLGGSDQWGNITSGTEFIRRNLGEKAYALTAPLLTKSDGQKFGKSESGNIWLDPEMTSPYAFYQFWLNIDDLDISKFMRYFSLRPFGEIEALEAQIDENPRHVKRVLAEELTRRIHSDEDFEAVLSVSELVFNPKADAAMLPKLSIEQWKQLAQELPSFSIDRVVLQSGVTAADLLAEHTSICSSKGEARRAIQSNSVAVNKQKVTAWDQEITSESLLQDGYMMVENGKRKKYVVKVLITN